MNILEKAHNITPIILYKFWDDDKKKMYRIKNIIFGKEGLPEICIINTKKKGKQITISKEISKGILIPSTNYYSYDGEELYFGDIVECMFLKSDKERVIIWDNGFRILGLSVDETANVAKLLKKVGDKWQNKDTYEECLKYLK